jgi:RimJ/RimL family protein N-acetyltransferase
MLGIKAARFQRFMGNGAVTLRLYRFQDLPALYSCCTPEVFLRTNGVAPEAFRSVLSFYRWLRTTFQLAYVVEGRRSGEPQMIGFVGLHNIEIGRSLWLSFVIFHLENRQRGYGGQALELLLHALQKNGAAKTVFVEVLKTNVPSLCFCKKLGFVVRRQSEDKVLLEKPLEKQ